MVVLLQLLKDYLPTLQHHQRIRYEHTQYLGSNLLMHIEFLFGFCRVDHDVFIVDVLYVLYFLEYVGSDLLLNILQPEETVNE